MSSEELVKLTIVDLEALSAAEWAQVIAAVCTAIAAAAACASVFRVEVDRWRRVLPELHIELLMDLEEQQVRLVVVNHGGPAREVRVYGALGNFGFAGIVPPSSYWQPGETRTVVLSMPLVESRTVHAFVEGRDMGMRHLIVGTVGGARYRWPLRKAKQLSAAAEWKRLFPDVPAPTERQFAPIKMTTIDRRF